jgi:hypothetical protein
MVCGLLLIIANWAQICKTSFVAGLEDSAAPPNGGAKRGAVISRDLVYDAHSGEHQDIDRQRLTNSTSIPVQAEITHYP